MKRCKWTIAAHVDGTYELGDNCGVEPGWQPLASLGDLAVWLWPGNLQALIDHARYRIRLFPLSSDECQLYFQVENCPAIR